MKTFIITPTDGTAPYEVQAETYEFSETSGRHLFYNGSGDSKSTVANLLNVSVREKPADPPANDA